MHYRLDHSAQLTKIPVDIENQNSVLITITPLSNYLR